MKILVACHYFAPEIGAPQARWSEMAKVWSKDGHEVQILTGLPNHPTGVIHRNYRGRLQVDEEVEGYRISRCWLYATPNEGFVRKTIGHLSFMASGLVLGWRRITKPDVVVVSSPTFFSIFTAWVLAKRFRVPLVVEVRDLWPGVFVELGILTNRWIIWLLERFELAAYNSAAQVVVVTEGFRDNLVSRGVPISKVAVITNGVDLELFDAGRRSQETRLMLGAADEDILVLYIGAHGISQNLRTILEAADRLRQRKDGGKIRLALVGDGAERQELLQYAEELRLDNLVMIESVRRDEVPSLLKAADIGIVPLRDIPLFKTFIPSKMFEFLAAGVPVIGALSGESAEILLKAGATVVPPEQPVLLADAIAALASSDERRLEQRKLGREFVESEYDRTTLARHYCAILAGLLS